MPIDYSQYPHDWKDIRARILWRAGQRWDPESDLMLIEARCEWCKAENHHPHPRTGSWVVLTVAHLDHDKDNHQVSDDRLAALCQACHLGYDREHHNHVRRMHWLGFGNPAQMELPI